MVLIKKNTTVKKANWKQNRLTVVVE